LLHVLLLFCPTFAFAWLSGAKRALVLGCSLALACEAAQTGFGYGFDWIDVLDLACDAAGIALALHAYDRMRRNR
jgi:glycopeptide antibiotics resistance protein